MESACYSINSILYAHEKESLYIPPNDIIVPYNDLSSLAAAESLLANVNLLIQNMRMYQGKINKILRESFLSD